MSAPGFPFSALVGLDELKLALQLSAIDHRLGVLIRGDKGAGKSTAARGLAALLDGAGPFLTLPIGATEDRLLGGLDVEKALRGEPALKPGLLAEAHGGVLYVDEVNLLPDHLADALLDAAAGGVHTVEREGFSVTQKADFVLIGSMNPEEGSLRPQLLDRFALVVDVGAPMDPQVRAEVLRRRLAYDADPDAFGDAWDDGQAELAARLAAGRERLAGVTVESDVLAHVAARVAAHEVRSLRADLAVVRAARALAALEAAAEVDEEHIERVLPLALAHRTRRSIESPPPPPSEAPPQPPAPEERCDGGRRGDGEEDRGGDDDGDESGNGDAPSRERVFTPVEVDAPRLVIAERAELAGRSGPSASGVRAGPVVTARPSRQPRELDVRASVVSAVTRGEGAAVRTEDLHEKVRAPVAGMRFVFVVDSSGSHAAHDRIRFVKGAVGGLLDASHRRRDEVVLISCRGGAAEVLVEPTSSLEAADRALAYLPTGGRTPLAHALELAAGYVTDRSVVVVLTDGRANVPSRGSDAWADARAAAGALTCPAVVVDTEEGGRSATGRPALLAEAMGGTHVRLGDLDQADVLRVIGALP